MSIWLEAIPAGARVFIYGAGRYGRRVFDELSVARPGVEIAGFVDSYRGGWCLEREVWPLERFRRQQPHCDVVVIASGEYWRDMETNMAELGYPCVVPAREAIWRFSHRERRRLEMVRKRITEGGAVFELVVSALEHGDNTSLARYYQGSVEGRRRLYFDYAPPLAGETVIEGGVFDGADTLRFAMSVGEGGRVYGFDPWGERQLDRTAVRKHPAVQLIPKALWSAGGILHFHADYGADFAGTAFVAETPEVGTETVAATSIDEFVRAERLERIDFVKLDVEGAEPRVLAGAVESLKRWRPRMAISAYHHPTHLYLIAEQVWAIVPEYRLYFEHYSTSWSESVFYFIPEGRGVS